MRRLNRRVRLGVTALAIALVVTPAAIGATAQAQAATRLSCTKSQDVGRAADDLHVRAGKSTASPSVGLIPGGAFVPVLRRPPVWDDFEKRWEHPVWRETGGTYTDMTGRPANTWYKVTWKGHPEWVAEEWVCSSAVWDVG